MTYEEIDWDDIQKRVERMGRTAAKNINKEMLKCFKNAPILLRHDSKRRIESFEKFIEDYPALIGDDEYNYLDYVQRREQAARDAEAKLCCICTQSSTKKCDQYGCDKPLCNSRYCAAEHKEKHFQPLT